MKDAQYLLRPVGIVHSSHRSCEGCPKQGWEGAPDAWLEIYTAFTDALDGIAVGSDILILTWLHKGRRDLLKVHPRGNPDEPL
jgi:tRNA (Thr-GGU) A37 N-methylase